MTRARPNLFGVPPGADFPEAVARGVLSRFASGPPEDLARVEIYVNTRRMQRRILSLFDAGPARLLPRIRLVTDLATQVWPGLPPAVPALRRRLELTQLVGKLLETTPDLAPRSAVYDLADSLAGLMDEMQGEGVGPDDLRALDITDTSGHWQRSLAFVTLVKAHLGTGPRAPDPEERRRHIALALAERWQGDPPDHPVIVAGSTGSRGATSLLMEAVARLPQGAVILPGFDPDLPESVWQGLSDAMTGEDHPQFRFARLLTALGAAPGDVKPWDGAATAPDPARNRLVSLALRPAPVTDQWLHEGPALGDLQKATRGLTLIEAPSVRAEATAIALMLRKAAEDGRRAALITPDRVLTRQVTAALDRWGILPDDSAGRPLSLSAPGRLLRHVAHGMGRVLTVEALLTILKHPLTASGSGDRGDHLLHTRELELHLRRYGPPFPGPADLERWAGESADRRNWVAWLCSTLAGIETVTTTAFAAHLDRHLRMTEGLAAGQEPAGTGTGELWSRAAGEKAWEQTRALLREAGMAGDMPPDEYAALFDAVMQRAEVREPVTANPDIMIWGTLEARVQGADLVIAAGLNEGVWPEAPAPDPWLNRRMRHDAGLLLPERRIGLAAHDFQQAVGAPEVVLTRAVRDAEAITVTSRWLNRLTNLLDGVSQDGKDALAAMRERGANWLALAAQLDQPSLTVPPAPRPAPRPPVSHRPDRLSITQIQTLIRDPYAIYARMILRLSPLDPLRPNPDAPLRGSILHEVVERFIRDTAPGTPEADCAALLDIADQVLARDAPWPTARIIWRAKLARAAPSFVDDEHARQRDATPLALERKGRLVFDPPGFTLTGKIDRIDQNRDGTLTIYDYKTGAAPSAKQVRQFDKQLYLAALMAEAGALEGLAPGPVEKIAHISLGSTPKATPIPRTPGDLAEVRAEFLRLIAAYATPGQGYTARRAMEELRHGSDYDHLARYGEWDETQPPSPDEVGA